MTRQNYGSLRGKRGGGAWQWTVIGFVIGFGCAAVIGLVLLIAGAGSALDGIFAANRPTQTPIVITNTPLPVTPTPPPTEVLLPSPTPTVLQVEIQAPSATPTTTADPSLILVIPSATATQAVAPVQPTVDQSGSGSGATVNIPALLVGKITPLRQVDGGTFIIGTTPQEVAQAVDECVNVYQGNCQLAYGEDSAPPHNVTIDPFFMEDKEVTYDQYMAFLNSMGPNSHRTGCQGQLCIATRAEEPNSNVIFDSANYRVNNAILNYPVAGVTWYGAAAYCAAIGRRLPTEAEWEHAGRGPTNSLYPWGDQFDVTLARTSRPREENAALVGAKAVASYPAGAYSLYDMAGNVAEWVNDWYSATYYTQQANSGGAVVNPQGPPAGTEKVVRGGSWDAVPFFSRSVHRQSAPPNDQKLWIGFRCASDTSGAAPAAGAGAGASAAPAATLPPVTGGSEEDTSNSQPTLPPPPVQPTTSAPLPTLAPGG